MSAVDNDWVIFPKHKKSTAVRLICFPNAGGGGGAYRMCADEVHPDVEVGWALWPGRESRIRERPCSSIEELVPALTSGLSKWLDGKFVFYGHSLGAKIAFEVSRELRRRQHVGPAHLFVGACQAPQVPWHQPVLHQLAEEQFIEQVQNRYGGIPRQVVSDPELRALLVPALRADVRLVETYKYTPEPPLSCPITAFGGAADGTVEPWTLDAWRQQTRNDFQIYTVPGDHFFVQSSRQRLLQAIATVLQPKSSSVAVPQ
jgi:medium-chain acyl-[acyl-carrier-protein] hydrolase